MGGAAHFKQETHMYLVLFLDQDKYEFNSSLHASLAVAKTAYEDLARRFGVKMACVGFLRRRRRGPAHLLD